MAPDIVSLLLGRFLQGFAAGACVVIARAVARDCYEGKELANVSASLSIAWAIVPMLAPVEGGYVQVYFEWHVNFLLLLIFAILGIMNVWVIAVPFFITYGAAGIIFANCVTLALMPFPDRAGAASALLGASQILIGCISSALMAFFSEVSQIPLAIYIVFCMSFAYMSVRFISRTKKL